MLIITPQHPDFYGTLSSAVSLWKQQVKDRADTGSLIIDCYGNLRNATEREVRDFLMGGELEETYEDSEFFEFWGDDDSWVQDDYFLENDECLAES